MFETKKQCYRAPDAVGRENDPRFAPILNGDTFPCQNKVSFSSLGGRAVRKLRGRSLFAALAVLAVSGALAAPATPAEAAVTVVYDNALRNGWQDWGWATRNLAQTAIFESAPDAISWEP